MRTFSRPGSELGARKDHEFGGESAAPDIRPRRKVIDLELHEIAAAQLAVDRKVEQRTIAEPLLSVEEWAAC